MESTTLIYIITSQRQNQDETSAPGEEENTVLSR